MVAGETQMTFDTVATSLPLARDGKLRVLAVVGPKRVAELPDVPTMREQGFPDHHRPAPGPRCWRRKPRLPAIIAKLNAAVNKALDTEPMKSTLAKLGAQPRGGTPQALADYMANETKKWKPIVAALNLKAD